MICATRPAVLLAAMMLTGVAALVGGCRDEPTGNSATNKTNNAASAPTVATATVVGAPAPEVALQTVEDESFAVSGQRPNVVVLDFWATWCPPCRLSLPHLQELSQDKGLADRGLKVFAVNSEEDKETINAFLKKNNYSFTVPMDV